MNLSLDYDDTYTRDPAAWDEFLENFRSRVGHKVYLVTSRNTLNLDGINQVTRALKGKVDGIFFTSGEAKQTYMFRHGIRIDVWIDDSPAFIVTDHR